MHIPASNSITRGLIIALLFPVAVAFSQHTVDCSALSVALSHSDVSFFSTWHGNSNPALLARNDISAVSLNNYSKFLLPELGFHSVSGTVNYKGHWGYCMGYFGTRALNLGSISISYGTSIFKWLDAGITLRGQYLSVVIIDELSGNVSGNIGLNIKPANGFNIALVLKNPAGYSEDENMPETLEPEIISGLSYIEERKFLLASHIHWCGYENIYLSFGSVFYLVPSLAVLSGVKAGSQKGFSYGLIFTRNKLDIIIGSEVHTELGASMALTLSYHLK